LDQFVDQTTHSIVTRPGTREDPFDRLAVGKTNRRTGPINRELPHQIACDLFLVSEQQLLEFTDIAEFPAVG